MTPPKFWTLTDVYFEIGDDILCRRAQQLTVDDQLVKKGNWGNKMQKYAL